MRSVGRPRLVDVAEAAGVSIATASFVMAGIREGRSRPASEETVKRIRDAAAALGYVPNRHAQAIRRGYANAIVLAIGSPEDPWGAQVAIEVQRRALGRGFSTLSLVDETWYEFLTGFDPVVALVTSTDFEEDGLQKVHDLAARRANLVVFSTVATPERFDVISSSPVGPTRAAYAQLRRRHGRVHFLSTLSSGQHKPGPTRLVGFGQAVAEHDDGDADELVQYSGSTDAHVLAACRELLSSSSRPLAVVCSTGYLAAFLRETALLQGLSVPGEVEIISIGDIPHNDVNHLGPISHYGVPNVFSRIGDIVVDRAATRGEAPFTKYEFAWGYVPGATTVE